MDHELSREDVARVVTRAIIELLELSGVTGPPVDAVTLADQLRLPLDLHELDEHQGQVVAAHALGEHLKGHLLQRLGLDPYARRPMLGVSLAGLFANRLLLPSPWFEEDAASCDHDLLQLQQRYCTATAEAIAWRFLDMLDPCIITVIASGEIVRRKSNGIPIKKKLAPPEVECQRNVAEQGRPNLVRRGGWTVQGWPTGSQRIVLRSVAEADLMCSCTSQVDRGG